MTERLVYRTVGRHAGRCSYCLRRFADLVTDHIDPIARGGTHTPDNLTSACTTCNSQKGEMSLLEMTAIYGPNMNWPKAAVRKFPTGRRSGRQPRYPGILMVGKGLTMPEALWNALATEAADSNQSVSGLATETLLNYFGIDAYGNSTDEAA